MAELGVDPALALAHRLVRLTLLNAERYCDGTLILPEKERF